MPETIEIPEWVYLHYPICQHHCSYCDFNVISRKAAPVEFESRWLEAFKSQVRHFIRGQSGLPLHSLYLGGGTPSLISASGVESLLEEVQRYYAPSDSFEFAIECNPENLSEPYLCDLKNIGINRVSLGVQTSIPGQLRRLERLATYDHLERALETVRKLFKNFSVDLMIGIPDQTHETLAQDLEFLDRFAPPHISVYLLTLDSGHKWFRHPQMREKIAAAELAGNFYKTVCERLRSANYIHYEVSNFAKAGFESRHNRNYWNCDSSYFGFGPGAHGYLKSVDGSRIRYETEKDLKAWMQTVDGISTFEILDSAERNLERLYLKLRTGAPISKSELRVDKLDQFLQEGWVHESFDGCIRPTETGWLLMESLAADLIP